MGRAKIAMEFIGNEKKRDTTYQKRKKGLIKKAHEFSILCNVPICMIIYPYKEGKQSLQPEVYSFKGGDATESRHLDLTRAMNSKTAREIIDRYLAIPREEKNKRALNLYDMFDEWKRRADQELSKLRHKNAMTKYPTWSSTISGFNVDQLIELLGHLDKKIDFVRQKIGMIKGINQSTNFIPSITMEDYSLIDQPTPISSLMNPSNNNAHLSLHHQMEVFNQLTPLDPNSVYADQMGSITTDQGSSSNLVYNMNMVGPIYYDQGPWIADNVPPSSSYGTGGPNLPISMPLHLPMMSNINPLPRHYN